MSRLSKSSKLGYLESLEYVHSKFEAATDEHVHSHQAWDLQFSGPESFADIFIIFGTGPSLTVLTSCKIPSG